MGETGGAEVRAEACAEPNKLIYATARAAKFDAKLIWKKRHYRVHPYECRSKGHWHLTSGTKPDADWRDGHTEPAKGTVHVGELGIPVWRADEEER